jgi:hypothetical protein
VSSARGRKRQGTWSRGYYRVSVRSGDGRGSEGGGVSRPAHGAAPSQATVAYAPRVQRRPIEQWHYRLTLGMAELGPSHAPQRPAILGSLPCADMAPQVLAPRGPRLGLGPCRSEFWLPGRAALLRWPTGRGGCGWGRRSRLLPGLRRSISDASVGGVGLGWVIHDERPVPVLSC